jgi:Thymidylate synthase
MTFDYITRRLTRELKYAPLVDVGEWQAIRKDIPQTKTREVQDVIFEWRIPGTIEGAQAQTKPNLPWAEDHFLERVSGIPYNPPPSHEYWPFAQKNNEEHLEGETFSHTYPERFWPRRDRNGDRVEHHGIRFRYGDLDDVVYLLQRSPYTRQAYVPIWFPEDTGAHHGERVPCTLGYHFLLRGDRLSCRYFIRSCDFLRHFRDDVYMAARLTQWIADQINATPGHLLMVIGSLHIFDGEQDVLQVEDREWEGMFT